MVSASLDSAVFRQIRDVQISYASCKNNRDLVVAVHSIDLPQLSGVHLTGRIFLGQVSIGAVVKALDDFFTGGHRYFSASMHHSGAKFRDVLGNACLYRLNGAAGTPLGEWLPSNFHAVARELTVEEDLPLNFYSTLR
ncbi:hypothetical protein HYU12_04610 [Candidatus Woesearchaeota archaeon]|nr:hypothetical protein [Candidatus Woesearchaeota archaeon]